jgi:hypothetical protein
MIVHGLTRKILGKDGAELTGPSSVVQTDAVLHLRHASGFISSPLRRDKVPALVAGGSRGGSYLRQQ